MTHDPANVGQKATTSGKDPRSWRGFWIALAIFLMLIIGIAVGGANANKPSAPARPTPAAAPAPGAPTYSASADGQSIIMPNWTGNKPMIAAYGLRANLGQGLVVQSNGSNGWTDTIVSQDPAAGAVVYPSTIITFYVQPGVGIGGYSGPASSAPATVASSPAGPLSSGTYMVGSEIVPGTWHTDGGARCYYERDRDMNGSISSIINNDNFTGPTTIAVSGSDAAVKFSGDCTWSKR